MTDTPKMTQEHVEILRSRAKITALPGAAQVYAEAADFIAASLAPSLRPETPRFAFLPGDEDLAADLRRFAKEHDVSWLVAIPATEQPCIRCHGEDDECPACAGTGLMSVHGADAAPARDPRELPTGDSKCPRCGGLGVWVPDGGTVLLRCDECPSLKEEECGGIVGGRLDGKCCVLSVHHDGPCSSEALGCCVEAGKQGTVALWDHLKDRHPEMIHPDEELETSTAAGTMGDGQDAARLSWVLANCHVVKCRHAYDEEAVEMNDREDIDAARQSSPSQPSQI